MGLHIAFVWLLAVAFAGAREGVSSTASFSYSWAYRTPYSLSEDEAGRGSDDGSDGGNAAGIAASMAAAGPQGARWDGDLQYTHMSTPVALPNGSLAVAWQGSTRAWEGSADQAIYWAVSRDGGATWGPKRLLVPPHSENGGGGGGGGTTGRRDFSAAASSAERVAPAVLAGAQAAAGAAAETHASTLPVWGPVLHVEGGEGEGGGAGAGGRGQEEEDGGSSSGSISGSSVNASHAVTSGGGGGTAAERGRGRGGGGGRLHLFWAASNAACGWGGETGEGAWAPGGDVWHAVSDDGGASFGSAEVIYPFAVDGVAIPKMLANQLLALRDPASPSRGRWLLPVWHEQGGGCRSAPQLHGAPGVLVSDDRGLTWRFVGFPGLGPILKRTWLIQGAAAEVAGGRVVMYFRTQSGVLWASASGDGGETWSVPAPTSIPNNNSKVNLISLPDGRLLLAYNDASSPSHRTPLALLSSGDGGASWNPPLPLWRGVHQHQQHQYQQQQHGGAAGSESELWRWQQQQQQKGGMAGSEVEDDPRGDFAYPTLLLTPLPSRQLLITYTVQFPPGYHPSPEKREMFGGGGMATAATEASRASGSSSNSSGGNGGSDGGGGGGGFGSGGSRGSDGNAPGLEGGSSQVRPGSGGGGGGGGGGGDDSSGQPAGAVRAWGKTCWGIKVASMPLSALTSDGAGAAGGGAPFADM